MSGERLLVPISQSATLRQTVEFAVSRALEQGAGTVRFVVVHPPDVDDGKTPETELERDLDAAEELLDRVSVWAKKDAGSRGGNLAIETGHIGLDRYLFSPEDVAEAIANEVRNHDIDSVVVDPEYDPGIGHPLVRPLESELDRFEVSYEEPTISRPTRRAPLLVRSSPLQVGSLFLVSFLFYMALAADPFYWFEWVTGVIASSVVAFGLSRVTFSEDPDRNSLLRVVRHLIYVPYLLWEIIKANIQVAAVILHPQLPIEPRLTRIRPAIWGGLPITTFGNSVTLTPGTLSVRVSDDNLIVHTLVPAARNDLFKGGLERAVRFVFYGRKAMKIPSPLERGDTEILQKPPDGDDTDRDESGDNDTHRDESGDNDTHRDESGGDDTDRDESGDNDTDRDESGDDQ